MTLHYHGTPVTPMTALLQLAGRHFCVSHARPDQVAQVHSLGQSVLLDNGAFSKWKRGAETDWPAYYAWCERWLGYATTWAIIPDVIDGGSQLQDALVREWPFGHRGAPVWHMDEPLHRLLALCDAWPKVCIGSTAEYRVVLSDPWRRRMDECWNALAARHRLLPWVHMLRGMQRHALAFRLGGQHRHRAEPQPPSEHAARHGRPLGRRAVSACLGASPRTVGACRVSQTYTQADLRRNITVYRQEAERARKWAAIRRQEAVAEDARAKQLDARIAELEAMLPGLPERAQRTARRHARTAGADA